MSNFKYTLPFLAYTVAAALEGTENTIDGMNHLFYNCPNLDRCPISVLGLIPSAHSWLSPPSNVRANRRSRNRPPVAALAIDISATVS